jgi:hypothetical protein
MVFPSRSLGRSTVKGRPRSPRTRTPTVAATRSSASMAPTRSAAGRRFPPMAARVA